MREAVLVCAETFFSGTPSLSVFWRFSSFELGLVLAGFPYSHLITLSSGFAPQNSFIPLQFVLCGGPVKMSLDPMASVNACWARVSKGGLYKFLFSDIEIVYAEKGKMVAKLKVGPNHLNSKGGLHGSTSATIVDWCISSFPRFCLFFLC